MASVLKITPVKGSAGNTLVIHGDGFKPGGSAATVRALFGQAGSIAVVAEVESDKVSKLKAPVVPATAMNPADPSSAIVRVVVEADGQVQSFDGFSFTFGGGSPVTASLPTGTVQGTDLVVTIPGSGFTAGGRAPTSAYEISFGLVGTVIAAECTDTVIKARFSLQDPSWAGFCVVIGFSDGTGFRTQPF